MGPVNYTVSRESFEALESYRLDSSIMLDWSHAFVLPVWMKTWWDAFGAGYGLSIYVVRREEEVIGVAPLKLKDGAASPVGSPDVCDYMDFITVPGEEEGFFTALLDRFSADGIGCLEMRALRSDSAALRHLAELAGKRGLSVCREQEDVTLETELPGTWDDYLQLLSTKQRHEMRRKLRRLYEAGEIDYKVERDRAALGRLGRFLELFAGSREDKQEFLTPEREKFIRKLARETAWGGILRTGTLEAGSRAVAMVLGFEHNGCLYLYNSGFDREYEELSVGLLSKALFLKWAIEKGLRKFDFLKGGEVYKYRLGGSEVPVYNCSIQTG